MPSSPCVRPALLLAVVLAGSLAVAGCRDGSEPRTAVTEPAPSVPATSEPAPSGPGPSEPAPSEPAPSGAAAAGCPAELALSAGQPWVPAPPTTGTPGRLVPDADPVEVLVCRYGAGGGDPAALEASVLLRAGLDRVQEDLGGRTAPVRDCPGGADGAPHLARLRYADGELWLSGIPGSACAGNGDVVTATDVGRLLAAAADAGRWVGPEQA